jgi:hypothetical protein
MSFFSTIVVDVTKNPLASWIAYSFEVSVKSLDLLSVLNMAVSSFFGFGLEHVRSVGRSRCQSLPLVRSNTLPFIGSGSTDRQAAQAGE